MSPEQAMGDRTVDARSDEYSLAAVVYEMLVGEPPHTGPNLQAIIAKLLSQRPVAIRALRETVPLSVATAVEKGLAKLPADRFPTVGDFVSATTAPTAVHAPETRARSWTRVAIACALGAISIVAIYALVKSSQPAERQSDSSRVAIAPPAQRESSPDDLSAADSARAAALDARRKAVATGRTTNEDLARGDAHLDTAEAFLRNGRVREGVQQLTAATTAWANTPRNDQHSQAEIKALVRNYARAVEWQDPKRMKAAFPELKSKQQEQWDLFFRSTRAVTAQLAVTALHIADDTADAELKGTYAFVMRYDGRSDRVPVSFHATFKRVGDSWRLNSMR
jgi:hypothetical protein